MFRVSCRIIGVFLHSAFRCRHGEHQEGQKKGHARPQVDEEECLCGEWGERVENGQENSRNRIEGRNGELRNHVGRLPDLVRKHDVRREKRIKHTDETENTYGNPERGATLPGLRKAVQKHDDNNGNQRQGD